jgi:hypothetical protein
MPAILLVFAGVREARFSVVRVEMKKDLANIIVNIKKCQKHVGQEV